MNESTRHLWWSASDEKRRMADEIYAEAVRTYREFGLPYIPSRLERECQYDFRLCSLVAYRMVTDIFAGADEWAGLSPEPWCLTLEYPYPSGPAGAPEWFPMQFAGTIGYDRLFRINRCAFSSPDSVIGFGKFAPGFELPFKILKGLKFIGRSGGWTFFKLDPESTDDMTAMLLLPLEKNFEIEFAHFPHDGEKRIIFRWIDS